ncbi:hypothetical protein HOI26_02605 [Candidatus Woesearchaeota archaeon]|jgi:hypothetical protein|nr:hypothetical protein [Candidatus Woesearchaeota archaeon]MBT5739968.1 hypothetical protein [Candidatus Woesearchaeota archaeon]
MALFQQGKDPHAAVKQLRQQGLTDTLIMEELTKQGFKPDQVHAAITSLDGANMPAPEAAPSFPPPGFPTAQNAHPDEMYGRIEEIAGTMIDQKWDEMLREVQKIIAWKERVESQQKRLQMEVEKLKEDFKTLHHGVLGKLEDYDHRMQDVGTELKAVGKVFKDVVPEFVDNVKILSSMAGKRK